MLTLKVTQYCLSILKDLGDDVEPITLVKSLLNSNPLNSNCYSNLFGTIDERTFSKFDPLE